MRAADATGVTPELIAERVTRFGRLLRGAGLRLGPGRILRGLEALREVDVTRREDVYWALHAAWVARAEDRELYAQAFRLFWRDPNRPVNRVLEELLALSRLIPDRPPAHARRRVLDALERDRAAAGRAADSDEPELVRLSPSDRERLREKDFEQMSGSELREAERLLERLRFPSRDLPVRRWRPVSSRGSVDLRRTLRSAGRRGGDLVLLHRRRRRRRPPALVVLCDISGSMAGYTRMLLRFLHALHGHRDRVHTLLFGTRLTNVTRSLRHSDPDVALAELGNRVRDWEGGTRIGRCLGEFNREWSRRVLGQGADVLLVTDGLERDDPDRLRKEAARLARSSRTLIWLNPLLRYSEFRPKARGVRALLDHVDEFRPVHNLASLEALADALGSDRRSPAPVGSAGMSRRAGPSATSGRSPSPSA